MTKFIVTTPTANVLLRTFFTCTGMHLDYSLRVQSKVFVYSTAVFRFCGTNCSSRYKRKTSLLLLFYGSQGHYPDLHARAGNTEKEKPTNTMHQQFYIRLSYSTKI